MNNFSFQRIKLLLKADYTEYKIYLYYALGAFAAIISVAFIIMNIDGRHGTGQVTNTIFFVLVDVVFLFDLFLPVCWKKSA